MDGPRGLAGGGEDHPGVGRAEAQGTKGPWPRPHGRAGGTGSASTSQSWRRGLSPQSRSGRCGRFREGLVLTSP